MERYLSDGETLGIRVKVIDFVKKILHPADDVRDDTIFLARIPREQKKKGFKDLCACVFPRPSERMHRAGRARIIFYRLALRPGDLDIPFFVEESRVYYVQESVFFSIRSGLAAEEFRLRAWYADDFRILAERGVESTWDRETMSIQDLLKSYTPVKVSASRPAISSSIVQITPGGSSLHFKTVTVDLSGGDTLPLPGFDSQQETPRIPPEHLKDAQPLSLEPVFKDIVDRCCQRAEFLSSEKNGADGSVSLRYRHNAKKDGVIVRIIVNVTNQR